MYENVCKNTRNEKNHYRSKHQNGVNLFKTYVIYIFISLFRLAEHHRDSTVTVKTAKRWF